MKLQRRFFFLLAATAALLSISSTASAGFVVGTVDFSATVQRISGSSNSIQLQHNVTNLRATASSGTGGWTANPLFILSPGTFTLTDSTVSPAAAITFGDSSFGTFSSTGAAVEVVNLFSGNAGNRTITWQGVFTTGSSGFFTTNGLNHNATVRMVISKGNGSAATVLNSFQMTTAVPEPTSLSLIATALVGGVSFFRRRKSV